MLQLNEVRGIKIERMPIPPTRSESSLAEFARRLRGFPRHLEQPFPVPRSHRPMFEETVRGCAEALAAVARHLFGAKPARWRRMQPPEALVGVLGSPLPAAPLPFFRLDAHFDPDRGSLDILEFNCADPSGIGLNDALIGMCREGRRRSSAEFLPMAATHLRTLRRAYAAQRRSAQCGRRKGLFLLIDPQSPTASDFLCLLRALSELAGPVELVRPEDVDLIPSGSLVLHDYIYELIDAPDKELSRAWRKRFTDGDLCMVTSPHANVLESKGVLEFLTSPRWAALFSPAVRRILRRVSWTRRVSERKTDLDGREVDLPAFIAKNKAGLVLKPCYGYGGQDVLVGRDATTSRWEAALERALSEPLRWAVQRRSPPGRTDLPGGPHAVLSLWGHDRSLSGIFARLSGASTINVRTGARLAVGAFIPQTTRTR